MDNENVSLSISCSPHVRTPDNTRSIMLDVVIALIPAMLGAIFFFGLRAMLVMEVSVAACVVFEFLFRKILKKDTTVGDCSAVVTGILLALACPATIPYWAVIIGDFFAIVVIKQLFGGIGRNVLNPAVAGRTVLLAYPVFTVVWPKIGTTLRLIGSNADAVTAATPLTILHQGVLPGDRIIDCFVGNVSGSMGETSVILLLVGFAYLLVRRIVSLRIPVAYVATAALIAFFFPQGHDRLVWTGYQVCAGGLMLGAIFMATDYTTTPVTKLGQIIFGVGCGVITMILRYFGPYAEGVSLAILVMNLLARPLDRVGVPRRFGAVKEKKETEAG